MCITEVMALACLFTGEGMINWFSGGKKKYYESNAPGVF